MPTFHPLYLDFASTSVSHSQRQNWSSDLIFALDTDPDLVRTKGSIIPKHTPSYFSWKTLSRDQLISC